MTEKLVLPSGEEASLPTTALERAIDGAPGRILSEVLRGESMDMQSLGQIGLNFNSVGDFLRQRLGKHLEAHVIQAELELCRGEGLQGTEQEKSRAILDSATRKDGPLYAQVKELIHQALNDSAERAAQISAQVQVRASGIYLT